MERLGSPAYRRRLETEEARLHREVFDPPDPHHLGLWRERKGSERGTAPLEGPASDTDLVYEPVDDGWPGYEEPTYTLH